MEFIPQQIWAIGLVFARLGALFTIAPLLGDSNIPARIRLSFALALSFVVGPVIANKLPPIPSETFIFYRIIGVEILIGISIALTARILFSALSTAGSIVSMQTGLSMAMMFDPTQSTQGSSFSAFLAMVGTALLFEINAHHWFILGAVNSYNIFAANGHFDTGQMTKWLWQSCSLAFSVAVQITAPLIVFGIIYNVALGIINRVAPQIQVFFIGQPVQLMLGMVLFMLSIGSGLLVWAKMMLKPFQQLAQ